MTKTPTHVPNALFPTMFDYLEFTRPHCCPRPLAVEQLVSRALSHPEDYRAQTAHLRSDIERHALLLGMSDAVQQLRDACKGLAQSQPDACAGSDAAPKSTHQPVSPGTQGALPASSGVGLQCSLPLPSVGYVVGAVEILSMGVRFFERHIQAARELEQAAMPNSDPLRSPGFVVELIAQEATRAGAVLDVLSALCPEIAPALRDAHTTTARTLRDIRYAVLAKLSNFN